jgi:hypothetical protein
MKQIYLIKAGTHENGYIDFRMKINNFKNETITGLIVFLFSITFTSCVEDTGNYNYKEINTISISGINGLDNPYRVGLGDSLIITPALTFLLGEDKDTCKYEWHLLKKAAPYESDGLISSERNLEIIAGGLIPSAGEYLLMYCVTNLSTGLRYDHVFKILVEDRMLNGYIMLCERENDSFDIDLISIYQDTLKQYHNVLEIYNSELPRLDRKPLDLLCYGDHMSPNLTAGGRKYAVWILTDKSTDRVRVENFEYQPEYNIASISRIVSKYLPAGKNIVADKLFSVSLHTSSSGKNYLYFNGNFFFYNFSPMGWLYTLPVNAPSITEEPYKVAPYLYTTNSGAIMFDETHNRFEFHKAGTMEITNGSTASILRTFRLSGSNYFDWQNPDYRLLYMSNRTATGQGYAIVKNAGTGKYELLQMSIALGIVGGTLESMASQQGKAEFPAGINLDDIRFYAYHTTLPYLYLATEDKVYRINTTTMAALEDISSQVLPSGHKISKMKSSAIRFPRTALIMLASYDPNKPAGQNGQLAFYGVEDGTGDLQLAKHPASPTAAGYQIDMKWTGFGKIINVDYKQPQ